MAGRSRAGLPRASHPAPARLGHVPGGKRTGVSTATPSTRSPEAPSDSRTPSSWRAVGSPVAVRPTGLVAGTGTAAVLRPVLLATLGACCAVLAVLALLVSRVTGSALVAVVGLGLLVAAPALTMAAALGDQDD